MFYSRTPIFSVYINDIFQDIQSNIRLFAEYTTLFIIVDNPVLTSNWINHDFKTESLLISSKRQPTNHPTIHFNGNLIQEVKTHKHLELIISNNGHWDKHIEMILAKASLILKILRKNKFILDRRSLEKT